MIKQGYEEVNKENEDAGSRVLVQDLGEVEEPGHRRRD